ncbi:MAG: biotin-dependent carboxyltransferase family protein [Lachnospiraceae bacterium]|nr:biotin-dependent carboxyltransferase family protein [Lachnospiraceae bacterium]
MSIRVIQPGVQTTVQDLGRFGYQQYGVPVAGAMDPRSMKLANILLDNDPGEAVLEITIMGPQLLFEEANYVALTGGDLGATLDGQPMPRYQAVLVQPGQTLRFLGLRNGCRAYLAFAGGLDIPMVMGSRSTYLKAKMGGFKGRKLEAEDVLEFRAPNPWLPFPERRRLGVDFVPQKQYELRVILGPQDDYFTKEGLATFLKEVYTVSAEFDRMGCRLEGAVVEHKNGGDIISDGIAFGAIQVPSAGKPIIMAADRQTTGGYTKIATVISADFRYLGQLKGGDKVHFVPISVEQAENSLFLEQQYYQMIIDFFNRDRNMS